jgi:DNA-binding NtrC family response regulator
MGNSRLPGIPPKYPESGEGWPYSPRNLLCFDSGNLFEIEGEVCRKAGWHRLLAHDIRQVRKLIQEHEVSVGLCVLEPDDVDTMVALVRGLTELDNRIVWVAVLSMNVLDNPALRMLVANYFWDFHVLPIDPERLTISIGHAYGMAQLGHQQPIELEAEFLDNTIIGTSDKMKRLRRVIQKIAAVDAPVLIRGETGTGKGLAARAIHNNSDRAAGPFVVVNCAALPESIIQTELFGHEKGAFTGAYRSRKGRFELANGSTIFLDEIGDLSPNVQISLLRVLEEKLMERVGSSISIDVDVRVLAATHVDLEKAVRDGSFREDLYYRLNILQLDIPSLRERGTDVELLAKYYYRKYTEKGNDVSGYGFSSDAIKVMNYYSWPGNVRELANRVRRAVIMKAAGQITPADLCLEHRKHDRRMMSLEEAREIAEKNTIKNALAYAHENITVAAQDLGISRSTMYRFMEKYGIQTKTQAE